ncbi:MAG: phenylalanine--tRNA ligase subunit beta [Acutalibacteraceae bacterium]|nr:phenylalanine--tRNA ligase subunit beta [Acutalibacteraceae bacterium]
MFVSINWIKEYVDLEGLDIKKLINSFTLATAEVEDIIVKGEDLRDVVVGEILSIENHPNSKKLHLLKVDGGDRIYDVVCGAPNVRENMKIAFVKAGGRVPAGEITKATVAGFESEGMCCSAFELGLSDDKSGLMEIDVDAPNGTNLKDIYPIDDIIFEVDNKSLTNRPDLWGHYGIAREFAALTDRDLKPLPLSDLAYDGDEKIKVTVGRDDLVYRYSCVKMDNITKNVSPMSLQIRLYYCGMRGINLLADLTNYIMLEMGQPTHAFDANKIDEIVVDTPKENCKFTTLDNVERDITTDTLLINNGSTPVAIAGIMGGLDSEIVGDTNAVVLECANFDGVSVRKSSSRLGLRTDASARYEKMLDPEMTVTAAKRFAYLLQSIDEGAKVASQLTDEYVRKYPEINISFNKDYVDKYTGIDISEERILKTLTALGFDVYKDGEEFKVKVPSFRATKDVTIKADIIEEITRIYGYDNFSIITTKSPLKPVKSSPVRAQSNEMKDILVKHYNLHEVHSYIWCDVRKYKKLGIEVEENVKVLNIESSDNGTIRNSMIPTLLSAVSDNKDYSDNYGIFEIGRVVAGIKEDGTANERRSLGIVLFDKTISEKDLFFKAISMVNEIFLQIKHKAPILAKVAPAHAWQHPKNTASISCDGVNVGTINTLHPANAQKLDKNGSAVCIEIDVDDFITIGGDNISFVEPSTQQSTYYDLSLIMKEGVTFADMSECWNKLGLAELNNVKVIDTYEKDGVKSLTVRLIFSSKEKTLEMDEVQAWIDEILANLKEIGIEMRA